MNERIDQFADLGASIPTDAVILFEINPANGGTRAYRKSTVGNLFAGFSARRTTNQSVASGAGANVVYDLTEFTDANVFGYNSGTGSLTILQAGKYLFSAGLSWDGNATGVRSIALFSSGPSVFWALDRRSAASTATTGLQLSRVVDVAANMVFQVSAFQTSGGALNINATNRDNYLCVHRIAP